MPIDITKSIKKKISDLTKLTITRDSSIAQIMVDFLIEAKKDEFADGSLNRKVNFIDKLNQGLT